MNENEQQIISVEEKKARIRQRYKGVDEDQLSIIPAIPKLDIFDKDRALKVAAYCRVSTDDPNQTSSYELQKNYYTDLVTRNPNWSLVDIYADDTDAKERQYKAAADLSAGHKMVTVSECGNIPEPIKCIAAGEKWCWFMAWDLESYSLNTTAYWKNVMASSKVITRENMPSLK